MGSLVRLCYFLLIVWNKSVRPIVISDIKRSDLVVINPKTTTYKIVSAFGTRLSSIEGQFKNLSAITRERDLDLQMLINQHILPDIQINTDPLTTNKFSSVEKHKEINLNDIVQHIKSNEFEEAEKKLITVDANAEIPKIVHEAYGALETNFESIIKFAEGLSNITYSFNIFKSLAHEMQVNGHQDPLKLIRFAEALRMKVTIQHIDPNDIKADALAIINGLDHNITTITTQYFADAIKSADYQKNSTVHLLADAIDDYRTNISEDVMQALVDTTIDRIELNKILANVVSHTRINQAITGIIALFAKIKNAGQLNNSTLLDLAFHLSKLRNRYDYGKLSPKKILAVDKVLEEIPTCARNLFFEQSACLWNKEHKAYLYAADSSAKYDKDRRRIFVSSASNIVPPGASWIVEKIGDNILLKSTKYVDEYLYAVIIDYNPGVHYVFNWIPGKNTDPQSEWNILLHGDYCYIKSVYFDEYLYASMSMDTNELVAVTSKSDILGKDTNTLWQIRSC